jgi:hypothetical protein
MNAARRQMSKPRNDNRARPNAGQHKGEGHVFSLQDAAAKAFVIG